MTAWSQGHRFERADVVVVYGGESAERDVSLRTGSAVLDALLRGGFAARGVDLRLDALAELVVSSPDVVFVALHGTPGEDGTLQGALEYLGIPYTGSGVLASALCMDKIRTKQLLRAAGVPTAPWAVIERPDAPIPQVPGLPCVVKPSLDGSSVGLSIVHEADAWPAALAACAAGRGPALCEALVRGRELTVALLGDEVLGLIEIRPASGVYDYDAKYVRNDTVYAVPDDLGADTTAAVYAAATSTVKVLGCRGVCRVDVLLDADGTPWVLEANTVPGMTATSLVPKIAATRGWSFDELVARILAAATTDAEAL